MSDEQKVNLHEVADLMLKIYETLAEMRYIEPEGIERGPHDISSLNELKDIDLDPATLYLYSILPYIDHKEAGESDFFHGGTFADFRDASSVERGRDPFYADPQGDFDTENGQYIRPWVTPLSHLGNHGTVLIYDAWQHRIWAIDQEGWGTTDPALCSERTLRGTPHEVVHETSDWGSDSGDDYVAEEGADDTSEISEDSSEYWSDDDDIGSSEIDQLHEDQQDDDGDFDEGFDFLDEREQREAEEATRSKNTMNFDYIKSRPAGDFLRSIVQWYRELKEVPGGGEHSGGEWMELETLRPLYLKHGWPDNFDGDAFEIDQARAYCAQRAKYFAEDPLRQVECYESWLKHDDRERKRQEVDDATNDDEKWTARFGLWQAEQTHILLVEELAKRREKAALHCPGGICQREEDLPLWELAMLRDSAPSRPASGSESSSLRERRDRRKAEVYAKACEASAADAERLCPGRTLEYTAGITRSETRKEFGFSLEQLQEFSEDANDRLQKLQHWASQLPGDVDISNTRRLVQSEVEQHERQLEKARLQVEQRTKLLKERANAE